VTSNFDVLGTRAFSALGPVYKCAKVQAVTSAVQLIVQRLGTPIQLKEQPVCQSVPQQVNDDEMNTGVVQATMFVNQDGKG
jgi:predicted SpoU family rRNA methylase